MLGKIKSILMSKSHVASPEDDTSKRYFKEYPLAVLDCVLKMSGDDRSDYQYYVGLATKGVFGRLKGRFAMPLFVRLSILYYDQDPEFAELQAKKALNTIHFGTNKVYTRHDIMFFYCVMARLYAFQGNAVNCIMSLKNLENCILDCDTTHPVIKGIQRRAKSFLAVICRAKQGSYIEEANALVSPADISNLVSIEKLYKVLYVAFHNKKTQNKYRNRKRSKRDLLYDKIKELYFELPNPICGAYERGRPEMRTTCINEFLTIYTDQPRRSDVTEDDIRQLEVDYPEITFNRNNLKFLNLTHSTG